MKNVFYSIEYIFESRMVRLFGVVQNSLLQTISELQLGGVEEFQVKLLTAEEFNSIENRPYNIPIK